jgi:hypothetical protein
VQIPNRPSFLHTRKFAREAIFPVQAAFWRKQFGELRMQAEEVRVLLEKVTESVQAEEVRVLLEKVTGGFSLHAVLLLPPESTRSRTDVLRHAATLTEDEALPLAPKRRNSKVQPNVRSSALQQIDPVRICRERQRERAIEVIATFTMRRTRSTDSSPVRKIGLSP